MRRTRPRAGQLGRDLVVQLERALGALESAQRHASARSASRTSAETRLPSARPPTRPSRPSSPGPCPSGRRRRSRRSPRRRSRAARRRTARRAGRQRSARASASCVGQLGRPASRNASAASSRRLRSRRSTASSSSLTSFAAFCSSDSTSRSAPTRCFSPPSSRRQVVLHGVGQAHLPINDTPPAAGTRGLAPSLRPIAEQCLPWHTSQRCRHTLPTGPTSANGPRLGLRRRAPTRARARPPSARQSAMRCLGSPVPEHAGDARSRRYAVRRTDLGPELFAAQAHSPAGQEPIEFHGYPVATAPARGPPRAS